MPVVLITGPVRSGKSSFAQRLALESGRHVSYVATALLESGDRAWTARIDRHRRDRPHSWETIETSRMDIGAICAIFDAARADGVLVVDSLGTWISAVMSADIPRFERDSRTFEADLDAQADALVDAMDRCAALVVVVGEQVGWDVVPVAASARVFRDVLGRMEQRLAAISQHAYLVVAGFAVDLRVAGISVK